MKKVLVIAGPTASGKSSFAVRCAKMLKGKIISGDSIQVYRGLNIGSGKVTKEEMEGIPHHLIDIKNPDEKYSACDFQNMVRPLIEEQDPFPIIAGGTGLYLKACLYDYDFHEEEEAGTVDPELENLDNDTLYQRLLVLDPVQAEKIHPHNRQRLLRSLTLIKRSGRKQSELVAEQSHEPIYDLFIAGCTMDRSVLYERIDQRVQAMIEQGLEEEVKALLENGVQFTDPGMKGIGYREWQPYMEGTCTLQEVIEAIQKNSRHYAKRQYTWLNHQMPVHWFNSTQEEEQERMLEEIRQWRER